VSAERSPGEARLTAILLLNYSSELKPRPRRRLADIQRTIGQLWRHSRPQHQHRPTIVRKSDILGPRLVRPELPPPPFPHKSHGGIVTCSFSGELLRQPDAGSLSDEEYAISSFPTTPLGLTSQTI
jgi:hypothetical protein